MKCFGVKYPTINVVLLYTRASLKNRILTVYHENIYYELSYRCTRDWPKIPEDVHKEIQASEDCGRLPTLSQYFTQISEGYPTIDSVNSLTTTLQKKRSCHQGTIHPFSLVAMLTVQNFSAMLDKVAVQN